WLLFTAVLAFAQLGSLRADAQAALAGCAAVGCAIAIGMSDERLRRAGEAILPLAGFFGEAKSPRLLCSLLRLASHLLSS
ncbi:MAG: hypothetical protein ACKO23_06070, partial [Gemmataceae bacterium]